MTTPEQKRAWYERNREAVRLRDRARYLAQRESFLERARAQRLRGDESYREGQRRYDRKPDVMRTNADKEATRRAQRRATQVCHIDSLILIERDDGICGICGSDIDPLDYHIDHIVPLSLGGDHTYDNTQVAHPSCNLRKGNRV